MDASARQKLRHQIGNILQPLGLSVEYLDELLSKGQVEKALVIVRSHLAPMSKRANEELRTLDEE
jgi:hypothetical protein